jgi:hypothetical protein
MIKIVFLKKNIYLITTSLALFTIAVLIAFFFHSGQLNESVFVNNKESIQFIFKLFEVIIVLLAGFLAYLRFFKGQLFLSRIEFDIKPTLIHLNSSERHHFFNIEIHNIGDYTIYNPIILANISYIPELLAKQKVIIKDGEVRIDELSRRMNHVLRAKTLSSIDFDIKVSEAAIKALKVEVQIIYNKRLWKKIIIVDNKMKGSGE